MRISCLFKYDSRICDMYLYIFISTYTKDQIILKQTHCVIQINNLIVYIQPLNKCLLNIQFTSKNIIFLSLIFLKLQGLKHNYSYILLMN